MTANAEDLSCKELVELITDYLEGKLPAPDRTRLEMHLCYCQPCRAYLEQMRQTAQLPQRLPEETLPPETKAALLRAFRGWKRDAGEEP